MSRRKQESTARLTGSEKARRHAAVILEVLAGLRGTHEASDLMGVSPNRYYQLEARALTGLIKALEPLPRGKQAGPEDDLKRLASENERLSREVTRLQSLVRVARRSLGIDTAVRKKKVAHRRRKPSHRGKKVVALLKRQSEDGSPDEAKES